MSKENALKMQDILSDYYSALAKFENVRRLYELDKEGLTISDSDDEFTKRIKESRLNELLVDLGRVGELSLKYIIKLAQIKNYPNQSFEQFNHDSLFKKGPLKSLANKNNVPLPEIDSIINYIDVNNQPFHNFDYLFLIIEKLLPNQAKLFNRIIEYSLISRELLSKPLTNDESENYENILFPDYINRYIIEKNTTKELKERVKTIRRKTIKESGDIFTRLRYFSNNPQDKTFNFEEIYALMKDMITYVRAIHECNDDIDFDPIEGYGKVMALDNPNLICRKESEIRDIFALYPTKTEPNDLIALLFNTHNYSLEELKDIVELPTVKTGDITAIVCNYLRKKDLLFFNKYGVTDYDNMGSIKNSKNKGDFIKSLDTNFDYTLEELEAIATHIEASKYQNLELLMYLTEAEIIEVNKKPELLYILLNDFNISRTIKLSPVKPTFTPKVFVDIMSVPEVKKGEEKVLKSISYYHTIHHYIAIHPFLKSPQFYELVNQENLHEDLIVEHIKENIKLFKNYLTLQGHIPYMLDPEDNLEIVNILIENGLDIEHIKHINLNIFYTPLRVTKIILDLMKKHNLPLIVDNNINSDFDILYKLIVCKIEHKEYEFPSYKEPTIEEKNHIDELEQLVFKK